MAFAIPATAAPSDELRPAGPRSYVTVRRAAQIAGGAGRRRGGVEKGQGEQGGDAAGDEEEWRSRVEWKQRIQA